MDAMKTYINMAKIVIAVGSAISTYLLREREAGRSPFSRAVPEPAARPQPGPIPPCGMWAVRRNLSEIMEMGK